MKIHPVLYIFFSYFSANFKKFKNPKKISRYFENTPMTEISHYFEDFRSGSRVAHENVRRPEPNFDVF